MLRMQQFGYREAGGVAGEEGLSAARRDPKAGVGHARGKAGGLHGDVGHGRGVVPELHGLERRLRAAVLRAMAEEIAQRVEHPVLVFLQRDHEILIS